MINELMIGCWHMYQAILEKNVYLSMKHTHVDIISIIIVTHAFKQPVDF